MVKIRSVFPGNQANFSETSRRLDPLAARRTLTSLTKYSRMRSQPTTWVYLSMSSLQTPIHSLTLDFAGVETVSGVKMSDSFLELYLFSDSVCFLDCILLHRASPRGTEARARGKWPRRTRTTAHFWRGFPYVKALWRETMAACVAGRQCACDNCGWWTQSSHKASINLTQNVMGADELCRYLSGGGEHLVNTTSPSMLK